MFINMFVPEDYLQLLLFDLAYTLVHFRTLNHRLPIQRGRLLNVPYEDRLCTKCLLILAMNSIMFSDVLFFFLLLLVCVESRFFFSLAILL